MFVFLCGLLLAPALTTGAGLGPGCAGDHDCTCSAGSYVSTYNTYGKPSTCEPCPAGTFGAKATLAPMVAACKPCAAGTFAESASSTACTPCPENTASEEGQSSCTAVKQCPGCTGFGWFWCMPEGKCTLDPWTECKTKDARAIAGPGALGQCEDECNVCVGASKYWCKESRQCVTIPMTQCTNFNAATTVGLGFVKNCPAATKPPPPATLLQYETPVKGAVNIHSYDYYRVFWDSVGVRVSVTCSSAACHPKVVVGADTEVTDATSENVFYNRGPCSAADPCDVHFDLWGLQTMFEDPKHPMSDATTQDYVVIGVYGIIASEYTIEVKSSATKASLSDGAKVLAIPAPPFVSRGGDLSNHFYETTQAFEIDLSQARSPYQELTITLLANPGVCETQYLSGIYGWPEDFRNQNEPCDLGTFCNGGADYVDKEFGWTDGCEWNAILHQSENCDPHNKCAVTRGTYQESTGPYSTKWVHNTLHVEVGTINCDQDMSVNPDPSSPAPYHLVVRLGSQCAGCFDDSACAHPGMTCVDGSHCEWPCEPGCDVGLTCDGATGKCVLE